MPNPIVDIDIELKALNKKNAIMAARTKKSDVFVVNESIKLFSQSAAKTTPPTGKVRTKRTIITYQDKRAKVPYRTNKKRGAKYFERRSQAAKFAPIQYRKIGAVSWLIAGAKAIGQPIPARITKVGKRARRKAAMIVSGSIRKGRGIGSFTIGILETNVQGIGKYAPFAVAQALRRTNNRLRNAILPRVGRKIVK